MPEYSRALRMSFMMGAPGMVFGIVQVNVRIPPDVPSGAVSITAAVGDRRSAEDVKIWIA